LPPHGPLQIIEAGLALVATPKMDCHIHREQQHDRDKRHNKAAPYRHPEL
jgi:hypothetical protein